jgi:hypothetical protein
VIVLNFPPVSSTNKAEIWLKVALNTIKQTNINLWRFWLSCFKAVGFLAPKEFSIIFGFSIFKPIASNHMLSEKDECLSNNYIT